MLQSFKIEIRWSVLYTITYLLWMVFENKMGWHDSKIGLQPLYNLLFVPIGAFIIGLALFDKKRNYFKNEMNWKQGFISGIILAVLITVLNPVVLYITHTYISPDFFQNAINGSISETYTLAQAQAQYNLNTAISNSVFEKLSFGVVIAAIISYFIQTKN